MELILGGCHQGKLEYLLTREGWSADVVTDGADCPLTGEQTIQVFDHLHCFTRRLLEAGMDASSVVKKLAENNPGAVFITDEIGYGVVPIDRLEREWREVHGRICCELARRSRRMIRVCCGVPTTLKEE